MNTITSILNSAAAKALVNDFIVSLGVATAGVVVGTWGQAQASAGVLSFIVAKTAIVAIGKAVLKWANS